MLDEAELLRRLKRHWEYSGRDEDVSHEIYHEDAVLEFPQSGERFEGVANFREWRRRGDKVAYERVYIMDPWDAPDWRAPWRSHTLADPAPPTPASPPSAPPPGDSGLI